MRGCVHVCMYLRLCVSILIWCKKLVFVKMENSFTNTEIDKCVGHLCLCVCVCVCV